MNTNRLLPTTLIVSSLFCAAAFAADTAKLETTKDKVSYAVGMNISRSLKNAGFDIDPAIVAQGLNDGLAGKNFALTDEEAGTVMRNYQQELRTKQMEK